MQILPLFSPISVYCQSSLWNCKTQQVIQAQRTAWLLMADKWAKAVLWSFQGQYSQMNSMLIW